MRKNNQIINGNLSFMSAPILYECKRQRKIIVFAIHIRDR